MTNIVIPVITKEEAGIHKEKQAIRLQGNFIL